LRRLGLSARAASEADQHAVPQYFWAFDRGLKGCSHHWHTRGMLRPQCVSSVAAQFGQTMRKAVQAGHLMAPTGDPAYDVVSHEMSHLQDRNARRGIYDTHPLGRSRTGAARDEESQDSKEARAFGYLFDHFTELRKFGSLPPGTTFDTWLSKNKPKVMSAMEPVIAFGEKESSEAEVPVS
jgi:hypothetical protein